MLFSFVQGMGSICPGAALDYIPRGWVGESCVVRVAHLSGLQVCAGSFETSWYGENSMPLFLRQTLGLGSMQKVVGKCSID
jgi:hypothetical protein